MYLIDEKILCTKKHVVGCVMFWEGFFQNFLKHELLAIFRSGKYFTLRKPALLIRITLHLKVFFLKQ